MSLHRRAAKRDGNEKPIVEALRAIGCSVTRLSGEGVPDLLVGRKGPQGSETHLLEVKMPKGALEPAQEEFLRTWRGRPVHVVHTPEEALRAVGAVR